MTSALAYDVTSDIEMGKTCMVFRKLTQRVMEWCLKKNTSPGLEIVGVGRNNVAPRHITLTEVSEVVQRVDVGCLGGELKGFPVICVPKALPKFQKKTY